MFFKLKKYNLPVIRTSNNSNVYSNDLIIFNILINIIKHNQHFSKELYWKSKNVIKNTWFTMNKLYLITKSSI